MFFCRRRVFKKKNLFFLLISLTLQFYGSSHVSDNRKTERHGDRNAKFMKLKILKFPPILWFLEEWTKVKFPSDSQISRRRFRPAIRAATSDTLDNDEVFDIRLKIEANEFCTAYRLHLIFFSRRNLILDPRLDSRCPRYISDERLMYVNELNVQAARS